MKAATCRLEQETRQASASGRWSHELRDHLSACASCREVAMVTAVLSGDAAVAPRRFAPSILWAKARFLRRRRAETLASRILVAIQVGSGLVAVVMLAYAATVLDGWSVFGSALSRALTPALLLAGAGLVTLIGVATARLLRRES